MSPPRHGPQLDRVDLSIHEARDTRVELTLESKE